MFPLGIIPALIGAMLFYGYFQEKDEVNKYVFLFLSFTLFTVAFFSDAIETAPYIYAPDPALVGLGTGVGIVLAVFLVVLMIRLGLGAAWERAKHFWQ